MTTTTTFIGLGGGAAVVRACVLAPASPSELQAPAPSRAKPAAPTPPARIRSRRVNSLSQLTAVAAPAGSATVTLVLSTHNEVLLGILLAGYGVLSLWVFARAFVISRERSTQRSR